MLKSVKKKLLFTTKKSIITTTFLLFVLMKQAVSQNVSDSLLYSFCNVVLQEYFADTATINKQGTFTTVLIETKLNFKKLISKTEFLKFVYIDVTPCKKRNHLLKTKSTIEGRMLYSLTYKIINIDTIDVNIHEMTLYKDNLKNFHVEMSCGGTFGYIPTGKFVFDSNTKKWLFLSGKRLLEKKVQETECFLQSTIRSNAPPNSKF
jgi:hypothetical protein